VDELTQARIPETTKALDDRIEEAREIIDTADDHYEPSHCFALFSGGYDSLAVTHLADRHFDLDGVVHIDTGIGAQPTRDFVEHVCDEEGWELVVYSAEEYENHLGERRPQRYEDLVIPPEVRSGDLTWLERGGFPGPTETGHGKMFDRLKGRPVKHLVRDHKQEVEVSAGYEEGDVQTPGGIRDRQYDRIMLITGIYVDESSRRFQQHSQGAVDRKGARLWVNPCYRWRAEQMEEYRHEMGLDYVNPAYASVGQSLECACGAFAKDGEKQDIYAVDQDLYDRIDQLEERAADYGYCWGYEQGPPASVVEAKQMLRADDDGQLELGVGAQLCSDCGLGDRRVDKIDQWRQAWEMSSETDVAGRVQDALATIRQREEES